MHQRVLYDRFLEDLKTAGLKAVDSAVAEEAVKRLGSAKKSWSELSMFWPPRLVEAMLEMRLVPFIGAGVSIAAGVPSWVELLHSHLKLTKVYIDDEDLKNDPLTMAEIASQRLGSNQVQSTLRELTSRVREPTASHLALAALRLPIYVTTNYDELLEKAWERIGEGKIQVVVNDSDLISLGCPWPEYFKRTGRSVLFKIHGCIGRADEQLILTRHDYRHHYRANDGFFDAIREMLQDRHVLFAGFSHRDPEVTRLVDDAIFKYETEEKANIRGKKVKARKKAKITRPHFYSLQFDMLEHTPEIFAAKGLVALRPPFFPAAPSQGRGLSLVVAIGELANAGQEGLHVPVRIDDDLHRIAGALGKRLDEAIEAMEGYSLALRNQLEKSQQSNACQKILELIGEFGGQGVYLADRRGDVKDCAVPAELSRDARIGKMPAVFDRPYFRIAKTFREPFISDSFPSKFNDNSTIALCVPLIEGTDFHGLIFAASHVGAWQWLLSEAEDQWTKKRSMLLLDSDGIALLPPNREFEPLEPSTAPPGETAEANKGFSFERLFGLSRRDSLARHLVENIVPLSQDDDVYEIGGDLEYYSVVTEIPQSRWKLGIAQPFMKHR